MEAIAVTAHGHRLDLRGLLALARYIAFDYIPVWAWLILFLAWALAITVAVVGLVLA